MITQTTARETRQSVGSSRSIFALVCGCMLFFLSGCGQEKNIVVRACEEGAARQISCEDKSQTLVQQCIQGEWVNGDDACPLPPACQEGATEVVLCATDDQIRTRTCSEGVWIASACRAHHHGSAPTDACIDGQELDVLCESGEVQHHACIQGQWSPPMVCAQECVYDDRQEAPCGLNDRGQRIRRCNAGSWESTWLCLDPDECRNGESTEGASCGGWVGSWSGSCEEGQWMGRACEGISLSGAASTPNGPHPGFCALHTDGTPHCWGDNHLGQRGSGHQNTDAAIEAVHTDVAFSQVAYGPTHSCGVSAQGEVFCWGDNRYRVVKTAGDDVSPLPQKHAEERVALQVAVGPRNACVITSGRLLWCWGENEMGQLTVPTHFKFHDMFRIETLQGVTDVSIGGDTLCAVANSGQVWCWGDNHHRLISDEAEDIIDVPQRKEGLPVIRRIAVGASHFCAARKEKVYCWGNNRWGQVGGATLEDMQDVVTLSLPADVTKLAVGNALSCAITEEHELYCWGSNHAHEIDGTDGASTMFASPTLVTHLPYVADVAISSSATDPPVHTVCAATQGGRVGCWGHAADFSIPTEDTSNPQREAVIVSPQ